jgi:starch-binding outer membrane protein, SusD/RagB family
MARPKRSYILCIVLLAAVPLGGCKKFVTVPPPPERPTTDVLFSSEAAARGVLSGIYFEMVSAPSLFSGGLTTLLGGLAADELLYYTPGLRDEFARNEITPAAHGLLSTGLWQPAYRFIYTANLALEKLPGASALSDTTRRQLQGEARFVRAFCYYYLVRFFGDVPLIRSTDYRETMRVARTPKRGIYAAILEDLGRAEEELADVGAPGSHTRPARQAATALRARVHLDLGQWSEAIAAAGSVIHSGLFVLAERPQTVFHERSPELIFYLEAPPPYYILPEATAILPRFPSTLPTYLVQPELLQAFEAGDGRREAWIAERIFGGKLLYFPAKYRGGSAGNEKEGYGVLRLAEQYLVRAEARIHTGDMSGALADLNGIRQRAGLRPLTSTHRDALLAAVEKERRVELAFEWGHRWNDLRRNGRAEAVLGALKGSTWQPADTLWPIPQDQIGLNPALMQNPGY